jgi:O-antigen ligase
LFSIAYAVETGSLEMLRQASYGGLDPDVLDIDLFRGIARAGVGNLLPVWICAVLYPSVSMKWKRAVLLALTAYFAMLAMLALRREVLIEAAVGLPVLWFAMPRGFRPFVTTVAIALGGVLVGTIASSERWQDRIFQETRSEFETDSDARIVLLLNTPAELMDKPLLGHGPGSYPLRMGKYFPPTRISGSVIAAHNSFSRAAVESGIVGLLGFVLMVAALGWRAVRSKNELSLAGIGVRFGAIMIFLHVGDWLLFGDGIASNTTWFFIGLLLYLDWCLLRQERRGLIPNWRANPVLA